MLKTRKFLFGLGTGIMLGAILVQLSYIGSTATPSALPSPSPSSPLSTSPSPSPTEAAWTGEQLDKAAQEQGKVLLSKEEYDRLRKPSATPAATPKPEAKPAKRYLYIYSGMSSNIVAEYLHQAGVIRDLDTFRTEFREARTTHKLIDGPYEFELDSDIDAVVSQLTGTKR